MAEALNLEIASLTLPDFKRVEAKMLSFVCQPLDSRTGFKARELFFESARKRAETYFVAYLLVVKRL